MGRTSARSVGARTSAPRSASGAAVLRRLTEGAVAACVAAVGAVATVVAVGSPASAAPLGNSDLACRPTARHPRPVVLVHGDGAGASATWPALQTTLRNAGFCVFAPEYGRRTVSDGSNLLDLAGGADIADSARRLSDYVARVRTATGATQVDLVGHSMGALTIRQYLRFDGGWSAADPATGPVHTVVSVSGPNHGTTFGNNRAIRDRAAALGLPADAAVAALVGPSYTQQLTGSSFLTALNAGGDTLPGVRYVALATHDDTVVTPPSSGFLTGGTGATVRNLWVQDGCPGRLVDHAGMTRDSRAQWLIEQALTEQAVTTVGGPCS